MKRTIIGICLTILALAALGRDASQVRAFRATHPCPSTNLTTGACPGYVVDHIMPLCIGGPDAPRNMQWQSRADSYRKDALEREVCRIARRVHEGD
jgi:hypothetical protein